MSVPLFGRRCALAALAVFGLLGMWAQGPARGFLSQPVWAAAQEPASQPAFRAGVELVSLNVTVMEGPRYATGLEVEDFQVFEDGVKQDVTYFTRTNLPVALALLIDTSASMDTRLRTAQEAAVGFSNRLQIGRAHV